MHLSPVLFQLALSRESLRFFFLFFSNFAKKKKYLLAF